MTLEPYTPDKLDVLALRVLDICGRLRGMAQRSRDEQLADLQVHDKKALEWLEKLEVWLHKAEADLDLRLLRQQGRRRAAREGTDSSSQH